MKWQIVRIRGNLYRHRGKAMNGFPVEVQAFEKHPEIRAFYGSRWFNCPNVNIHRNIAARI